MASRIGIILFGATGYTGRQVIEVLMSVGKDKGITWGVAARNEEKLIKLLEEISVKTGTDITNVPKFIADVSDERSLKHMAANALAVVNCAGPYRFYGEPVVKACIANGTHHFDISGEPLFVEQIQLDYHKLAEEKDVYVVSACAFNSLITEMGIIYMMRSFKGDLNSVETYLETDYQGLAAKDPMIHYGTWESNIYGLQHSHELEPLRAKLYPKKLPTFVPELKPRSVLHCSETVGKWCLPFPEPDRSNALRTQRYFYEHENKRPVQVQTYIALGGFLKTFIVAIVGILFALMTKVSFTRDLLLKHPSAMSFGLVSHKGPSEEARKNTFFTITFNGQGWSEKKDNYEEEHTELPNKTLITQLSGVDPTYGWTANGVVLSAVTAINESGKMPSKGGVYSPGAAFAKTSLLDELISYGLQAQVIVSEN